MRKSRLQQLYDGIVAGASDTLHDLQSIHTSVVRLRRAMPVHRRALRAQAADIEARLEDVIQVLGRELDRAHPEVPWLARAAVALGAAAQIAASFASGVAAGEVSQHYDFKAAAAVISQHSDAIAARAVSMASAADEAEDLLKQSPDPKLEFARLVQNNPIPVRRGPDELVKILGSQEAVDRVLSGGVEGEEARKIVSAFSEQADVFREWCLKDLGDWGSDDLKPVDTYMARLWFLASRIR